MSNNEDLEIFNRKECPIIDAHKVAAFFNLKLDELDNTLLVLENSWEDTSVDLEPAIKAGETVTHLSLSPEDAPLYLDYESESGEHECIYGDNLARIIPMTKLKDVSQESADAIGDGDVYVYDGDNEVFKPFGLMTFVETTNAEITALKNRVSSLETTVAQHTQQINQILAILEKPTGIPADTRLCWGNINAYGDYTNSGSKLSGLYTHNPNSDKNNDLRFS